MEDHKTYKMLIQDLRFCAHEFKSMPRLGYMCGTMNEAADSIEELVDALTSVCTVLVKYRQQESKE